MKNAKATGEAFSPQKRIYSISKHEYSVFFLFFWVIFALLDPDPQFVCGWVSGSATLNLWIRMLIQESQKHMDPDLQHRPWSSNSRLVNLPRIVLHNINFSFFVANLFYWQFSFGKFLNRLCFIIYLQIFPSLIILLILEWWGWDTAHAPAPRATRAPGVINTSASHFIYCCQSSGLTIFLPISIMFTVSKIRVGQKSGSGLKYWIRTMVSTYIFSSKANIWEFAPKPGQFFTL